MVLKKNVLAFLLFTTLPILGQMGDATPRRSWDDDAIGKQLVLGAMCAPSGVLVAQLAGIKEDSGHAAAYTAISMGAGQVFAVGADYWVDKLPEKSVRDFRNFSTALTGVFGAISAVLSYKAGDKSNDGLFGVLKFSSFFIACAAKADLNLPEHESWLKQVWQRIRG